MQFRSYKVSVAVKGQTTMVDNGLRFFHERDAYEYGDSLKRRWTAVARYEVIGTTDPPNAVYPMPSDRYPVNREVPTDNRVADPCPKCQEDDADKLVWMPDDTTVACLSCGHQFTPRGQQWH